MEFNVSSLMHAALIMAFISLGSEAFFTKVDDMFHPDGSRNWVMGSRMLLRGIGFVGVWAALS